MVNLKLSERVEAAEAAAALLKEELVETRQAVSWREEEVVKMRKANADSEVCFHVSGLIRSSFLA